MNKSSVAVNANGDGRLAVVPDIDLDSLASSLPKDAGPKLSVVEDYDLEELASRPDAPPVAAGPDFSTITVRKPNALDFIYVHPEWRHNAFLLSPDKARGQWTPTHLAVRAVAEKFPKLCRKYTLVPYANKNKTLNVWPIPLETGMGSLSTFSDSALGCIREGAGGWCRYEIDDETQRYKLYRLGEAWDTPEWPEGGMRHIVNAAFRGHIITDPAAEVLTKRVGQLVK